MRKFIYLFVLLFTLCTAQILIADTPTNTPTPYSHCLDVQEYFTSTGVTTTSVEFWLLDYSGNMIDTLDQSIKLNYMVK
jgi:hypothetical protein